MMVTDPRPESSTFDEADWPHARSIGLPSLQHFAKEFLLHFVFRGARLREGFGARTDARTLIRGPRASHATYERFTDLTKAEW